MLPTGALRRNAARARNVLIWGAACFILLQAGLYGILSAWWPLRDPEFGLRLVQLRARVAERPNRPLVVLLGSSRVAMGVRPELMATNDRAGKGPVVFNMGLCGSGAPLEWMALKRLLDAGVRPSVVVAEVWPHLLAVDSLERQDVTLDRLTRDDVRTLSPYYADARAFRHKWQVRHLCPWHGQRLHLLGQWAPQWLSPDNRKYQEWECVNEWGWLRAPGMADSSETAAEKTLHTARIEAAHVAVSSAYALHDMARKAYREMADRCEREQVQLVLLLMPDLFENSYLPAVQVRLNQLLRQLSRDLEVPLIDARAWATKEDFHEGVHLTYGGAEAFTRRFEREIQPCLAGQPFALRYPPGALDPSFLTRTGAGARR